MRPICNNCYGKMNWKSSVISPENSEYRTCYFCNSITKNFVYLPKSEIKVLNDLTKDELISLIIHLDQNTRFIGHPVSCAVCNDIFGKLSPKYYHTYVCDKCNDTHDESSPEKE